MAVGRSPSRSAYVLREVSGSSSVSRLFGSARGGWGDGGKLGPLGTSGLSESVRVCRSGRYVTPAGSVREDVPVVVELGWATSEFGCIVGSG